MKNIITVSVLVLFNIILLMGVLFITTPSFSHHLARGTVDEGMYKVIDYFVAETPRAEIVLDYMPETDTTVMIITRVEQD